MLYWIALPLLEGTGLPERKAGSQLQLQQGV